MLRKIVDDEEILKFEPSASTGWDKIGIQKDFCSLFSAEIIFPVRFQDVPIRNSGISGRKNWLDESWRSGLKFSMDSDRANNPFVRRNSLGDNHQANCGTHFLCL